MKRPPRSVIVYVTVPTVRLARRLVRKALEARLVACAQIRPGLESHYWWEGHIERSPEVLVTFKTVPARLRKLEAQVVAEHPFDTPQFIVVPILGGTVKYLTWIKNETKTKTKTAARA